MSDPVVMIEPADLHVEPGSQTRLEVRVRNPGTIVENFRIDVVSEVPGRGPATWSEVTPPEISVYPGETGSAVLVFTPPAGQGATGGRFAFGVRARSTIAPYASGVAEGDIEVGRVFGLQAAITPATSSGRWRGHHVVRYANWGNSPVALRLAVRDPDEKLGFLLRPTHVELPLGGSANVRLTVRTRKPFLRGTATRLPFEVTSEPDDGSAPTGPPMPADPRRPVVNGALLQKPILSRMTVVAAVIVVGLLAAGLALALRAPKAHKTFESQGVPATPAGVIAKAGTDGTIALSWNSVRDIEGYKVVEIVHGVPAQATKVDPDVRSYTTPVLTPSTKYCFAVRTFRGAKLQSVPSAPACATTAAAKPTATGSGSGAPSSGASNGSGAPGASSGPGGSGSPSGSATGAAAYGPDDWMVLVGDLDSYGKGQRFAKSAQAMAEAFKDAADITSRGLPVLVLHSTDYPNMKIIGRAVTVPFWVSYIPGKGLNQLDAAKVATSCRGSAGVVCTPVQPNSP